MTKYEFTYHNAETNNECSFSYDAENLADVFDTAWFFRQDKEYVYITSAETGETFIIVPEV